jgi:hypothetical protein
VAVRSGGAGWPAGRGFSSQLRVRCSEHLARNSFFGEIGIVKKRVLCENVRSVGIFKWNRLK